MCSAGKSVEKYFSRYSRSRGCLHHQTEFQRAPLPKTGTFLSNFPVCILIFQNRFLQYIVKEQFYNAIQFIIFIPRNQTSAKIDFWISKGPKTVYYLLNFPVFCLIFQSHFLLYMAIEQFYEVIYLVICIPRNEISLKIDSLFSKRPKTGSFLSNFPVYFMIFHSHFLLYIAREQFLKLVPWLFSSLEIK